MIYLHLLEQSRLRNLFFYGELVVKQIERKVNFLSKLEKDTSLSNKILTMDLETRNINGKLQPYCVAFYCVNFDGLERSLIIKQK